MKLIIKSIESERELPAKGNYPPSVITKFIGQDPEGNLGTYDTFSRTIKEKLGQAVEGEVKETDYGKSFKPTDSGFTKKPFGKSPEERHEIIAQNAMSHATAIVVAMIARGDSDETALKRLPGLAKRIYDATLTVASSSSSPVDIEPTTEVASTGLVATPTPKTSLDVFDIETDMPDDFLKDIK